MITLDGQSLVEGLEHFLFLVQSEVQAHGAGPDREGRVRNRQQQILQNAYAIRRVPFELRFKMYG